MEIYIGTYQGPTGNPYEMYLLGNKIKYIYTDDRLPVVTTVSAALAYWKGRAFPEICGKLEKWLEIPNPKGAEEWNSL